MIKWLTEYQDEAVNCEAIVLSTVLNPRFRRKVFALHYPEHNTTAQLLIDNAFNNLLEENEVLQPTSLSDNNENNKEQDEFDIFGVSNVG